MPAREREVRRCHYCGAAENGKTLHRDHFVPRSRNGPSQPDNLVLACGGCNSTKGSRTFEAARRDLLLKRMGWPKFTAEQLAWLGAHGFDITPIGRAQLYFEESGS
jgi:5-methylcytosine-specific restriction endonuclease McrA